MSSLERRHSLSTGPKLLVPYLAAISAVLLVSLVLSAPRPVWAPIILALAFVTAVLAAVKALQRWLSPVQRRTATRVIADPADRRKERIADVLLPSGRRDYYFLFSATVVWSSMGTVLDESVVNMGAHAVDAILKRAREFTENRDPADASLVQHELARRLGEMQADITGRLRAMAESVRLALPDQDRERLDRLADVRKEEAVWEHERRHEQNQRAYLGSDVLKDHGSAVVWWLARNNEQMGEVVKDIGLLAQLSAAANNTWVPDPSGLPAAGDSPADATQAASDGLHAAQFLVDKLSITDFLEITLRKMGFDEEDPRRVLFARQVADIAAAHDQQDAADEIMRRFDVPGNDDDEEGEDGGG
jgi:hypothetical protein